MAPKENSLKKIHDSQAGGGGGSYCSGSSCLGITGGNMNDHGFVKIFEL